MSVARKILSASGAKGVPINFVDAVSGTGAYGSTANITVSTDDFIISFQSGEFAYNADGIVVNTATISSITQDISSTVGNLTASSAQTNYFLDALSHATVTSGGTVYYSDSNGGKSQGFGLLAVDGGDSLSFNQGTSGSISVSSVTSNDIVVIFEIAEDSSSGVIPSTPSGYTSAVTYNINAGKGGGSTYIGARVSYKTAQSGTVSHTVTTAGGISNTGVIIRIYNA